MSDEPRLRLALQKSGRLSEDSLDLISSCGIRINRRGQRLTAAATNFPVDILYLRDDDIPEYVSNGVADVGIVGNNMVEEYDKPVEVIEPLGFSRCRLSLAVPKSESYDGPASLNGKTIATTYKNSLKKFLEQHNVKASIREIHGSTELAPGIGLSDAVCDLVSTGGTLLSHGLKEVDVLLDSEAVLISSRELAKEKQEILEQLVFRVRSVLKAKDTKYILMNAPNESLEAIVAELPGLKSPTIIPLAEEGWSSIHTVIDEKLFWEKIDELKKAGAEGILVSSIEKIIA